MIEGDAVGEVNVLWQGAGVPTASAVVAISSAAKHFHRRRMFYWTKPGQNIFRVISILLPFIAGFLQRQKEVPGAGRRYFGQCHDIESKAKRRVAFVTERPRGAGIFAALRPLKRSGR
jgi:hypothetical protein